MFPFAWSDQYENQITEIDPSGSEVWPWNARKFMDDENPSETISHREPESFTAITGAIYLDNETVIASLSQANRIVFIDRRSGDVKSQIVSTRPHTPVVHNNKIVEYFIEKTKFDVPQSMVDNYKSYLIEDYKSKNPDSFDEKKMEDEFNQTANKNIKWLLIREFLMNKEKVSLESKEVEDKIQEMIQQSPEYKKDIIKFYNDDANKNKLKEDMLNNKFFSKLENYFINKRKEVPTDKIKKH